MVLEAEKHQRIWFLVRGLSLPCSCVLTRQGESLVSLPLPSRGPTLTATSAPSYLPKAYKMYHNYYLYLNFKLPLILRCHNIIILGVCASVYEFWGAQTVHHIHLVGQLYIPECFRDICTSFRLYVVRVLFAYFWWGSEFVYIRYYKLTKKWKRSSVFFSPNSLLELCFTKRMNISFTLRKRKLPSYSKVLYYNYYLYLNFKVSLILRYHNIKTFSVRLISFSCKNNVYCLKEKIHLDYNEQLPLSCAVGVYPRTLEELSNYVFEA